MKMRSYQSPEKPDHRWRQVPESFTFPKTPIDLELGCGNGRHSLQYCCDHPERTLIAVEKTRSKFNKFLNRISIEKPKNLLAVHADGTHWVASNIAANSISRCFILYPNPYPKAKQSNLRWHNMPFFSLLLDKMMPGGQIIYCSNLDWYIEEAIGVLKHLEGWELSKRLEIADGPFRKPRTDFEAKYLKRGETCFEIHLTKH